MLKGDVTMAITAVSVIEGLIRQLDPNFDIVNNATPYFFRYSDSPYVQ